MALIAGRGRYPLLLAERARAAGAALRLIALKGETRDELWEAFAPTERSSVGVGNLAGLLDSLAAFGTREVVLAGQVTPSRLFDLRPDWRAVKLLATLRERSAATLFGAVCAEIENAGHRVLDARVFMDEDLAEEGLLLGKAPPADDLALGAGLAAELARLNIGQGLVISGGTVLAVEAFEGTDRMLERAGTFGRKNALFVKRARPGQDFRFDVPVFGERSVKAMQAAGIRAAAVGAGEVLLLDKPAVIAAARKAGISLTGVAADAET